jgi:hypothetical protein
MNTQINTETDYMIPSISEYRDFLYLCTINDSNEYILCNKELSNLKNRNIPLQERKKSASDIIIEHMRNLKEENPFYEKKIKNFNKLFLKKTKSNIHFNKFKVGDLIIWEKRKWKILKINKCSLTLQKFNKIEGKYTLTDKKKICYGGKLRKEGETEYIFCLNKC